jgi:hypothetical protein
LDGTFDTMFDKIGVSALNGSSNLSFPQHFPRFVQYAIWQYCSEGDLDVRNGNRINDAKRCGNVDCRVRAHV